ncbi:MAG: diacylglycerol/lipid kinase family protein [Armatimonadota bacterium]
MPARIDAYRPLRAKLIFNATAGRPEDSTKQLADILTEMQNRHMLPDVCMVRPDTCVKAVVRNAIRGGIKLVVVAGGDGTIDSIAGVMAGSSATLGIIPTGTRNNVAFNLGIVPAHFWISRGRGSSARGNLVGPFPVDTPPRHFSSRRCSATDSSLAWGKPPRCMPSPCWSASPGYTLALTTRATSSEAPCWVPSGGCCWYS